MCGQVRNTGVDIISERQPLLRGEATAKTAHPEPRRIKPAEMADCQASRKIDRKQSPLQPVEQS